MRSHFFVLALGFSLSISSGSADGVGLVLAVVGVANAIPSSLRYLGLQNQNIHRGARIVGRASVTSTK